MLRLIYRRSARRSFRSTSSTHFVVGTFAFPGRRSGPFVGASSRRHVFDGRIGLRSHRQLNHPTIASSSRNIFVTCSFVVSRGLLRCSVIRQLILESVPATHQHQSCNSLMHCLFPLCMC